MKELEEVIAKEYSNVLLHSSLPDLRINSQFAIDSFMPFLHNYTTKGLQWQRLNITRDKVLKRNKLRQKEYIVYYQEERTLHSSWRN